MTKFLLTLPKELHQQVKSKSALEGKSMNDFILEAIKEKLKLGGM
ncbi:MAG: toxin-antitoxin system HicB family antitoxin [Thermosipho sp. (in: Bacteria)]|nr:toxin-antitoxin system HicB family antitoxin [Thermosipho sp. (in: thermotogales)]